MDIQTVSYLLIGIAAVTLLVVIAFYLSLSKKKVDNQRMVEIAGYISKGSMAYLKRQYMVLSIFIVLMFVVLAFIPQLGVNTAICFCRRCIVFIGGRFL